MEPNKQCDNCGKTAVTEITGGHTGQRIFYYCDNCLPPKPKMVQPVTMLEVRYPDA